MTKLGNSFLNKPIVFIVLLLSLFSGPAQSVSFDIISASPIGSWQSREQIEINHKGKKTGTKVNTSMVGKEKRDGQLYYWVEMKIDTFKINKKGKRKPVGKTAIIKSLVPATAFKEDPENVVNNLRAFGLETIIQNGNEQPIRMTSSGGIMSSAMKIANVEIKHDYKELGSETVTVAAGEFNALKVSGQGTVTTKILFKKMKVESDSTAWVSKEVPFGIVKMIGTTLTNGKKSTQSAELLEYGLSGAKSEITQEPQTMPSLKNMFGG